MAAGHQNRRRLTVASQSENQALDGHDRPRALVGAHKLLGGVPLGLLHGHGGLTDDRRPGQNEPASNPPE
jgi:hypothetical protein